MNKYSNRLSNLNLNYNIKLAKIEEPADLETTEEDVNEVYKSLNTENSESVPTITPLDVQSKAATNIKKDIKDILNNAKEYANKYAEKTKKYIDQNKSKKYPAKVTSSINKIKEKATNITVPTLSGGDTYQYSVTPSGNFYVTRPGDDKSIKGSTMTYTGNSQPGNAQYNKRDISTGNVPFTVPEEHPHDGNEKYHSAVTMHGGKKNTPIVYIQKLVAEIKKGDPSIKHKNAVQEASSLWRKSKEIVLSKDMKEIYDEAQKMIKAQKK